MNFAEFFRSQIKVGLQYLILQKLLLTNFKKHLTYNVMLLHYDMIICNFKQQNFSYLFYGELTGCVQKTKEILTVHRFEVWWNSTEQIEANISLSIHKVRDIFNTFFRGEEIKGINFNQEYIYQSSFIVRTVNMSDMDW